MTQITQADLARFQQEINNGSTGDRAGFYLDYYNLTGSKNALFLAQISSFSGVSGGAALIANQIDAAFPNYPGGGVEAFSKDIAQKIYDQISADVNSGGTGVLPDTQLVSIAQNKWDTLQIGNLFPGNSLSVESLVTGDWSYFSSHTQDVLTIGTGVGLFSGAASTVGQVGASLNQFFGNLLNNAFGITPPSLPPGYTQVTSNNGQVAWITDPNGKVVYGSVHAPLADQFPALSAPVQITTPSVDGYSGVQITLNPNNTGSIVANDQTVNFTSADTPSLSVASNGNVAVQFLAGASSPTITFDLSGRGISTVVGGEQLTFGLSGQAASVDASGNITFASDLGNITIAAGSSTAHLALINGTNFNVTDPQSISDDGDGNLHIAASDPFSAGTANLLYNGNTGDLGFSLIGNNGLLTHLDLGTVAAGDTITGNALGFSVNNGTGQQLQALQATSDGGYTTTTLSANGTNQSHYNLFGQLTTSTAYDNSGNYAVTAYSTDPNSSWYSQSVAYNNANQVIGTSVYDRNGYQTVKEIDPATGATTTLEIDDQNNLVSVEHSPGTQQIAGGDYGNYVKAVADTLASQVISNVLIKNDLPASIAATAFTDAVISHATGSTADFSTEFSSSLFTIAGGIAGSDAGAALAQLLGLPSQIGALAGGVTTNLVAQYLVQRAGDAAGIDTGITGSPLDLGNFEAGFAAAGGAYIGSQLANIVTPTNTGGEIAGAVATTAAILAIEAAQPELLILDTFLAAIGADFVGTLIGDIFGGLFGDGYRGRPYAEAHVGIVNGQFALVESSQDNNGDTQEAITLANDVDQIVNPILTSIGGTATGAPNWSIGYHGTDYHSELTSQLPTETDYGDPTSAVAAAVMGVLKDTTITGGNPYMLFALNASDATSLQAFAFDLNAARDYSLYIADPASFDIALALGTPEQLANWQAELARVQELGLDRLSLSGSTWVMQSSSSTALTDFASMQAFASQTNVPYQITFPNSSSNDFTLTEAQQAQYSDAISHITGAFSETIVADQLNEVSITDIKTTDQNGHTVHTVVTAPATISGSANGNDTISFANTGPIEAKDAFDDTNGITFNQVTDTGVSEVGIAASDILSTSMYIDLASGVAIETLTDPNVSSKFIPSITYTYNLSNFQNAIGSPGNDTLIAGGIHQTLTGNGGNDILIGYAGGQDTFKDTAAHLTTSTIQNFQATDLIDITDHAFTAQTSVNFVSTGSQSGVLNVMNAGATISSINIQGLYTSFSVGSDGQGGILVTDPNVYSAAYVVANLAALETLAASGNLAAIALSDSGTPTLAVTAAQLTDNAMVFGEIVSPYNLSVSGVTAGNSATVAGQPHVTSITITDTAANVFANLAALEALATNNKLSSIALTDSTTPLLTLTATQYAADAAALGKIASGYDLTVSGVTAANAAAAANDAHVAFLTVSDTGTNIVAHLASLDNLATEGKLSTITLTDSILPTLALTAAQYAGAAALGEITSAYNVSVTGVSAADAAAIAAQAHVTSITVSDSAANIVTNIAALEALATETTLSSITLTDSTTPTITLTSAQNVAGSAVLDLIGSPYNLVTDIVDASSQPVETYERFSNGTVTDTALVSGITLTGNNATGETLVTSAAGGDTVNTSAGSQYVVNANDVGGDIINASSGNTVNISGNGTTDTDTVVSMSNGTLNLASNARADLIGSGNIYNAGNNDSIGSDGANTINAGANDGIWQWDNGGATINVGANGYVSINDTGGDTVNAAGGDHVSVAGNGTTDTDTVINMSNGTLALADNARADLIGSGNIYNAGNNDSIGSDGANTINAGANDGIWQWSNGGATINIGANGYVSINDLGGDTVNAANGDYVAVAGNGTTDTDDVVNLSGGTLALADNARADLIGSGNIYNAGSNDSIGSDGANTINAGANAGVWTWGVGGDTINAGADAYVSLNENGGDTVSVGASSQIAVNDGSADILTLSGTGGVVTLGSGVSNISVTASHATINAANGVNFNLTGSNDTVVASDGIVYLNASTTSITFQGSNEIIHIRSGDTYTITGSNDTVIADTLATAHNGTTISSYNGTKTLVDVTGLSYDSSITATLVQHSGGYAGQIFVSDHGSLVDTINLQSVQNLGSLTVRPDGSGGTLVVDPPLSSTTEDSVHDAFADAWHALMGGTQAGASSSLGLGEQFDFGALTPNAPLPEAQQVSLQDFSHYGTVLIRDGPGQSVQPTSTIADIEHHTSAAAQSHDYADMHFDFSSLPPPPVSDHLDHHLQLFAQYAAGLAGDVSAHAEFSLPTEPDFQHGIVTHLAPAHHDWHL